MQKAAILILLVIQCVLCFAKEPSKKVTSVSGRDFYFASLAYKDFSSLPRVIFRQDKDRVDAYIKHLELLKGRYKIPLPKEELARLSRDERYDYFSLEVYVSVSEAEFRAKSFDDINDYTFKITYGKEQVEVYLFIDNPSTRGGDAEYIFDYDGNLISRKLGK